MAQEDNKLREYIEELLKKEVRVEVTDGVVHLIKHPFDEGIPLGELRKIVRKWARAKFGVPNPKDPKRPKPMLQQNRDKKQIIEVDGGGIGHTVHDSRNVFTLYSLAALPEMIEWMKFDQEESPSEEWQRKNRQALMVERYKVNVKIGKNTYTAYFVIRVETVGGRRTAKMQKFGYYNHYVE